MSVEYMHFIITGEYMTNFSRELWVEGRIDFAVKQFLCDSLPGLSEQQAIDIVTGELKLTGENDLFLEEDNTITKIFGIPLDLESAWGRLCNDYISISGELSTVQRRIWILSRQQTHYMAAYKRGTDFNIPSFADDREKFKKLNLKLKETLDAISWLGKYCNKSFKDIPDYFEIYPSGVNESGEFGYNPIPISQILDADLGAFTKTIINDERELVDQYLDSQKEIDNLFKNKITPNAPSEVNDAAWIAPNGDYYGLNGTIANFLHVQIADKLKEDGVITITEHKTLSPDTFMRREGWLTVHNGDILFEGNYYNKDITQEQINTLYAYSKAYEDKTRKVPKYGLKKVPLSGTKLKTMDKFAINKIFEL
jgi:hypothetical protein